MIDLDNEINAHFLKRWISVEKLISILEKLPKENNLYPNQVGNLTVVNSKDEMEGFIDIAFEEFNQS